VIEQSSQLLDEGPREGIRVDQVTARLLEGRFRIDPGPGGGWLIGERDAPFAPQPLLGKAVRCIGRERNLEGLRGYFEECAEESVARAVLVTGPPGQGKSRLLHEFLQRMRGSERGFRLIAGSADSLGAGSAFGLLAPMLRGAAGVSTEAPVESQRASVRALAARVAAAEAERVSAFLGELMGVRFEEASLPSLAAARREPRLMADQLLLAWLDWLEAECRAGPVVVVVDDLHWADAPSVQYLESALRANRERPLLVLGLARPEVHERFPRLWSEHAVTTLPLGGLSRKASERLLQAALGERVSAERRTRLAERADGNPFYVEELVRAVDAGAADGELPVTVLGMVQARLDALGDDAKLVLRAASVFGSEFREEGVQAVLGDPRSSLETGAWLRILSSKEIVHEARRAGEGPGYRFRHALLQDAAYAFLPEDDRAAYHRRAAEYLEEAGEPQAVVIAEHFDRGGAGERAVEWYRQAARQATEANDLAGVLALAERARACGASGEIAGEFARLLAEAQQWTGDNEQAMRSGTEALELLPQGTPQWLRACAVLVMVAERVGQVEEMARFAAMLLRAARKAPCDVQGLTALAHAGFAAGEAGHRETANQCLSMMEAARPRDPADPVVEGWLALMRAAGARDEGRMDLSMAHHEAAVAHLRRSGDLRMISTALGNLGTDLMELGAFARAEVVHAQSAELVRRMRLRTVVEISANQGLSALFQGKPTEAERLMRVAIGEAEKRGEWVLFGLTRAYLARALHAQGRHEEALEELRVTFAHVEPGNPYRPMALATQATVLLALGRAPEALEASREAVVGLASGCPDGEALVWVTYAETLHANGMDAKARAVLAAARDRLMVRAEAIEDRALRESFLRNVPDNARILALAAERGC
jgi:tetratricopeptide (TPR) repeat protein